MLEITGDPWRSLEIPETAGDCPNPILPELPRSNRGSLHNKGTGRDVTLCHAPEVFECTSY
eukprot:657417-Amorphochlora_amoeboformis.AAC.1